jgi:UDP-N-acetylglucosamine 4-epimerase
MTTKYDSALAEMAKTPKRWLVTGAAGFIGGHIVETLLNHGQTVRGMDNFITGHQHNLDDIQSRVSAEAWGRFSFMNADVSIVDDCNRAVEDIDIVIHQAALGSVPRSIEDPISSNTANVDGFLNLLVAVREAGIKRFVYASSSSVYGDDPDLPKVESKIGVQLSPYAVTKRVNELYARVFADSFGIEVLGLRYFNVFGARQDPKGAYAAVIPRWVDSLLNGEQCLIFGDGETSRDFCYIDNVVQANLLAAWTKNEAAFSQVYNIAYGDRTTLTELYEHIYDSLAELKGGLSVPKKADYQDFRAGDIRHSLADTKQARELLGYEPKFSVGEGLALTVKAYLEQADR